MQVQDFLKLNSSKNYTLLAGDSGLHNIISGANIMDNPKADEWLSPGELLVTSGYFFGEDKTIQEKYFSRFHDLNIAAVCIKPLTYYKEIPKNILKLSEQYSIPLIEVPYGIAFSKILHEVLNQLSSSINEEKQLALDSASYFFNSSLDGNGLPKIVKELSNMIKNPLIITDSSWEVLAQDSLDEILEKTLTKTANQTTFKTEALEELPSKVWEIKHPIHRKMEIKGQSVLTCIIPIFFNSINYGYVVVYLTNKQLSHLDYIILETAVMSIALEISQLHEQDRISNRITRDFFKHLLSGKPLEKHLLRTLDIDIDPSASYSSIIIPMHFNDYQEDSLILQRQAEDIIMTRLLSSAKKYLFMHKIDMQIFKQGNEFFAFLKTKNGDIQTDITQTLTKFIQYLKAQIPQDIHLAGMVGSPQDIDHISISYEEALQTQSYAKEDLRCVYFYDDFYLDIFLKEHIKKKEAEDFTLHYLESLLINDKENNTELFNTLKVYVYNHFNVASSSRELFIHRNTMLYRLEKIQDLLAIDIYSIKNTLALQLAFMLHQQN